MASWVGIHGSQGKFRRKRYRCILIKDKESTGQNQQQEVTLSFHPFNRQSRVVCKSDAERGSRNSVTAKQDQQPANSGMARWTVRS
jgi:hypothetical protein